MAFDILINLVKDEYLFPFLLSLSQGMYDCDDVNTFKKKQRKKYESMQVKDEKPFRNKLVQSV